MSDSTPNQLREALAEAARRQSTLAKPVKLARVRISAGGYLAVAAFLTFASLVCLRTNRNLLALSLIAGTWTIIPVLLFTDRISFDGKRLWRTGLFAGLIRIVRGRREGIAVDDIERIEVATLRTLRRGGNVRYRFRIEITGKGVSFAFGSGGKEFRRMAQSLLPRIPDCKLDARACELRDHLKDTKTVRAEAIRLGIAPSSVLDQARDAVRKRSAAIPQHTPSVEEIERAQALRQSANELRVAGCLRQSGEAFRRVYSR